MAYFSSAKCVPGGVPIFSSPNWRERYEKIFGHTYSFLPKRNGMVPNTAHILLHLATAGTLVCLLLKDFKP